MQTRWEGRGRRIIEKDRPVIERYLQLYRLLHVIGTRTARWMHPLVRFLLQQLRI
jgi:hypothetical protein